MVKLDAREQDQVSDGAQSINSTSRKSRAVRAREHKEHSAVEGRVSQNIVQDAPHENAVQSSVSNALREHCKDMVTPLSNGSNANSSCSNYAVRKGVTAS